MTEITDIPNKVVDNFAMASKEKIKDDICLKRVNEVWLLMLSNEISDVLKPETDSVTFFTLTIIFNYIDDNLLYNQNFNFF